MTETDADTNTSERRIADGIGEEPDVTGLTARLLAERQALEAVLENAPESGLVYLDADFRFIYANATYIRSSGIAREDLVGRNHFELFPNAENEEIFRRARDTGETVTYRAKPFEYEHQPWRGVTYWDWTLTPIKTDDDAVQGLVFSLVDVTDQVRRQQMSEALERIDQLIHSTLDFAEVMRRLVSGAVEAAGCESGSIALRVEGGWRPKYGTHLPEEVSAGPVLTSEQMAVAERAAEQRELVVVNDAEQDEEFREALVPFGIKSIIDVPLFVVDSVVGVLALTYYSRPVPFSDAVVEFARRLGASASLALSNARLYEDEHRVSEAMRSALARPVPSIPSVLTGVVHRPAWEAERVGGDFYDVFELDDARVAVLIGDVSGKGIKAAGLTETVRSSVRTLAYLDPSPALLLTRLNATLRHEFDAGTFVTAAFAVIEPVNGHVVMGLAGHPHPVLCTGKPAFVDVPTGVVLGAFEADFEEAELQMQGGTLLFYTDGVTEVRRNGLLFGQGRLLRAMGDCEAHDPQSLVDGLLEQITDFGRGMLPDDLAMVAVRCPAA